MVVERSQITNLVTMVRPDFFGFNPQTVDNGFQTNKIGLEAQIQRNARQEFDTMVETLLTVGLEVIVLPSPVGPHGEPTPDAVFPNNWFSTHPGKLIVYPMRAENRRWERQSDRLRQALLGVNVLYPQTLDLSSDEYKGYALEGTGSLVLDRVHKIAYALSSQRTDKPELMKWCAFTGYTPHFFHAIDFKGKPIYHTNVAMSLGEKFAVVCMDAIQSADERLQLEYALSDTGKTLIPISMDQMYNMAGNVLQTQGPNGTRIIVMSERALHAYNAADLRLLERHGLIVPVKIDTIEEVGGGSARCMMAEIFT